MFNKLKVFLYELTEFKKFTKLDKEKRKLVFYAEHKNQWDFFEDIINNLLKKNIPICYVSSSKNDPNLKKKS